MLPNTTMLAQQLRNMQQQQSTQHEGAQTVQQILAGQESVKQNTPLQPQDCRQHATELSALILPLC